jgi:hypothetical protein
VSHASPSDPRASVPRWATRAIGVVAALGVLVVVLEAAFGAWPAAIVRMFQVVPAVILYVWLKQGQG